MYCQRKNPIRLFLRLSYFILFILHMISSIQANRDVFDGELLDLELRFAIDSGKRDCFYQAAKLDHILEISYQVVDSKLSWLYPLNDNSDMRITFELFDPYNQLIIKKDRINSDTHIHKIATEGVYALCFDNAYSRISSKIVNLEIYLYSEQDDDRWGMVDSQAIKFAEENKIYSDSLEALKVLVNKIRDNLQSVSHSQDARRAIETRDMNVMSSLFRFINFFSVISLIMILLVGFCQIYLIRSLFERNSKLKCLFMPISFFSFVQKD